MSAFAGAKIYKTKCAQCHVAEAGGGHKQVRRVATRTGTARAPTADRPARATDPRSPAAKNLTDRSQRGRLPPAGARLDDSVTPA